MLQEWCFVDVERTATQSARWSSCFYLQHNERFFHEKDCKIQDHIKENQQKQNVAKVLLKIDFRKLKRFTKIFARLKEACVED